MADRNMMLTVDEYMAIRRLIDSERESEGSMLSQDGPVDTPKRKRRVSQYQRRWGANLKTLKAKHPRTAHATLMSRAHRLTRKEMKE